MLLDRPKVCCNLIHHANALSVMNTTKTTRETSNNNNTGINKYTPDNYISNETSSNYIDNIIALLTSTNALTSTTVSTVSYEDSYENIHLEGKIPCKIIINTSIGPFIFCIGKRGQLKNIRKISFDLAYISREQ